MWKFPLSGYKAFVNFCICVARQLTICLLMHLHVSPQPSPDRPDKPTATSAVNFLSPF